jgi:coproporphyrinogen III oxidase
MTPAVNLSYIATAFEKFILDLQETICNEVEKSDGQEKFIEDCWVREEGGGGITRIIKEGLVFEKGGVNTSKVFGTLPAAMQEAFNVQESNFLALGLSLVLHPRNPNVPTVHGNWRYFELFDTEGKIIDSWFGGGADLTPYYLINEDAIHFHSTFKKYIDPFGDDLYPRYKNNCDEYFVNKHRNNERRGIGGVFYDYLKPKDEKESNNFLLFQQATADAFLKAYFPIVERRKGIVYGYAEKKWQEIRRGRYIEFNLIHDRGTLFGLKTNGRTESILMSLPPKARFEYDYQPVPGSTEDQLLQACLSPKDWVNEK